MMRFVLIILVGLASIFLQVHASITVTDDTNQLIILTKPAERIVSLAPDITEILFAIGAGHKVVGAIAGSDFPAAAKQITQVGSYSGVDLEKVLALQPDLIITWGETFSRQLGALTQFGIPVYKNVPRFLEDVPHAMTNFGLLAGVEKQAKAEADIFLNRLAVLKIQAKPIRVFYQVGAYSLITINKKSWINQVIELCGGQNIFSEAPSITPRVDFEAVITANPDVIISDAKDAHWKLRWQKWLQVTAVKQGLLFSIDPDWIDRAGPRLLKGAEKMCAILQRARFMMDTVGSNKKQY